MNSKGYTWMIQVSDECCSKEEAERLAAAWREQDGCIGARVTGGTWERSDGQRFGTGYGFQAFMPDLGEGVPLLDGWRRVMVSDVVLRQCQATE